MYTITNNHHNINNNQNINTKKNNNSIRTNSIMFNGNENKKNKKQKILNKI